MSFEQEYKGYIIKADSKNPKTYLIVTSGRGGKIPDIMSGLFTSRSLCFHVIDSYLASKIKKVNDAEAKSES